MTHRRGRGDERGDPEFALQQTVERIRAAGQHSVEQVELVDVLVGEGAKVRAVIHNPQAAAASGPGWVSLRASFFARNTLDAWGAQIRAGDVVAGPYASFAESPIHEQDLAAVAARALRSDALVARRGRRLELTGPQSLTHQQMVASIGEVLGRPLRYQESRRGWSSRAWSPTGFPSRSWRR